MSGAEGRMNKASAINSGLRSLTGAVEKIQILIAEIKGVPGAPCGLTEVAKDPVLNLEETLNSTPGKLNVMAETITKSVQEMKEILI